MTPSFIFWLQLIGLAIFVVAFALVVDWLTRATVTSVYLHDPNDPHGGWIAKVIVRGKLVEYRGDCTVWHRVPDGKMADTGLSKTLCEAWTKVRWRDERYRRDE